MKEKTKILILTILCLIGCLLPIKTVASSLADTIFINKDEDPVVQSTEYPMYYYDSNTYVEITKERHYESNCFVAHIVLKDPKMLRGCFAYDNFRLDSPMSIVAEQHNAIFMINADYSTVDFWSNFVIRNGEVWREGYPPYALIIYFCIMDDGHFQFFDKTTTVQEALDAGVWHSFSFWGKNLFNDDGTPKTGESARHPRTFIGEVIRDDDLIEYYIVAADGRSQESQGLMHSEEAAILAEKGCTIGYNLDGGGSTEMIFDGKILNQPSAGIERNDHDFIYIERQNGD